MNEMDKLRVSGKLHGVGVYKKALDAAQKEIIEQLKKRQEIDKRIVSLKRTIDGLTAICDEIGMVLPPDLTIPPDLEQRDSLTESILKVLSESTIGLTPTQVRDALIKIGFNVERYKQEMVPIHNTLKRLVAAGTVAAIKDQQGKTVSYRWVSPIARALAMDPLPYGPNRNSIANMSNEQLANLTRKSKL